MSQYDWIEITHEYTEDNETLYCSLTTLECVLEKPLGTIKPVDPLDCWELWDEEQQRTFYYTPHTRSIQWERPSNKPVWQLMEVQKHSPVFRDRLLPSTHTTPCLTGAGSPETKRNSRSLDLPLPGRTRPPLHHRSTSDGAKGPTHPTDTISETTTVTFPFGLGKLLTTPTRKQSLHTTQPSDRSRRLSHFSAFSNLARSAKTVSQGSGAMGTTFKTMVKSSVSPATSRYSIVISSPVNSPEAAEHMNPLNAANTLQRLNPVSTLSTLDSPILPSGLRQDINRFAIDGFAQKYFSTHKRGLFRRRVPMTEMLQWTKESLKQPLIMLNKDLYKDALKCFKLIQTLMGDRPRPRNTSDIEDYRCILACGIDKGQMRDEIYVQVCKQLRDNPSRDSVRKGWEILCVISIAFPPSKNFEGYLCHFVEQYHHTKEDETDKLSQHVSIKLKRICQRGAKGKVLTPPEIERAKVAPFKPSVFGESLEFIMQLQRQDPQCSLQLPQIVPFLAESVNEMNGKHSEGIFRVSGDADAVTDLRIRIENGHYDTSNITDPNVPASLIKLWLRELSSPLILPEFYNACIESSEDSTKAVAIINSLPDVNRRIVLYMISFLQEFTHPAITEHTLMNIANLAMVFAPNFLRCPSESLTTVFENSKYEQSFLKTLIMELSVDRNACLYDSNASHAIGQGST
ncbi:hypothetical protein BDF14DRAFT_1856420 [Spinellus fusiger]|nr:hypothetical protein BDF14DRAFT_1856420 [Spinellus fusiger]